MIQTLWIWLQFGVCAALITVAGCLLSRYGDVIADKTGLSGNWIGLVLLATVTSLPELMTGISSVTIAEQPNIAVGNIFGSCVFNLAILILLDIFHRQESVFSRASQGHILSAAFGVVLLGFGAQAILLADKLDALAFGHVGFYAPVIVLLYVVAVRSVYVYEHSQIQVAVERDAERYPHMTLRQAMVRGGTAAAVVVGGGIWLPFLGTRIADVMGWNRTFVGTLFIASATSLPEFVVSIGAMRIGALDMAISNLLGSNLFNIVVLAVNDLFYREGPLLFAVAPIHAVSAVSASMMSGMVIVGLLYRPHARVFRTVGWPSLGLFAIYVINTVVLYFYGE